jgi:transposase
MAELVSDALWEKVLPLLPFSRGRLPGARAHYPIDDRACLRGIIFVVRFGVAWMDLPTDLGLPTGTTCLTRLRDWQRAGAWEGIRKVLEREVPGGSKIDWARLTQPGSTP